MCSGRILVFISSICIILLSYRIYNVIHRPLPPDIDQPEKLKFIDELGRITRFLEGIFEYLGVSAASQPLKIIVDLVLALLTNPVAYIEYNIQISETIFNGVPVHVYTPSNQLKPLPVFVFFHGGGWTWFSVGTYNAALRNFANQTNHIVIAVDYRKAPQYLFPAAYEDCLAVTEYVIDHHKELKIQPDSISVAGDGSGGNLAAAVALTLKHKLRLQLLINPALQMMNFKTPSYIDNKEVLAGLTSPEKEVAAFLRYTGMSSDFKPILLENKHVSKELHSRYFTLVDSRERIPQHMNVTQLETVRPVENPERIALVFDSLVKDTRLCPMFAPDLSGVPSAYIITSQYDVLRDEAIMYADRLQREGVKVKLRHYYNGFHGFFHFAHKCLLQFKAAREALDHLVSFLDYQFPRV